MKPLDDILIEETQKYIIPDFQRDFVWGKEEIIQLFDDFVEDTSNFSVQTRELEGYLLGNIVLIQEDDENSLIVIDGQQRLTTLTLLFKALNDVIKSKIKEGQIKWLDHSGGLVKAYKTINNFGEVEGLKIQHDPSLSFGEFYKALIHEENKEIRENRSLLTNADSNIADIYDYCYESLANFTDNQLLIFIPYLTPLYNFSRP